MAKQKSKKNFIVVVDSSGSMGGIIEEVCKGIESSNLAGQDVFFCLWRPR